MMDEINVFEYTDFRQFLLAAQKIRKELNPKFSHRFIALRAGFASSGYFSQILKGRTRLSPKGIAGICKVFDLKDREAEYFQTLVHYNQSESETERNHFFQRLASFKKSAVQKIDPDRYEFYQKWYHSAIRATLSLYAFRGNYKELAQKLSPPITEKEARDSIHLLLRLGFAQKTASGGVIRKDPLISTGTEAYHQAIHQFQKETMVLASEAIERFEKSQRSIATLTLSLSEKEYQYCHQKLQLLFRDIMEKVKRCEKDDRVYQLNVQLFPLTHLPEPKQ